MTETLMEHQNIGVEFLKDRPSVALVMDRGTGKTPTVLVDCEEKIKSDRVGLILYVAPLSTLVNVGRECKRFTTKLKPVILMGERKDRIRQMRHRRGNIFIINPGGVRIMLPELMDMGFGVIVMDEATKIKDRTTQISRAMSMLAIKSDWRRNLTGMPIVEGVEDAYSQFNFLDPKILNMNYWAFRNRYCILRDGFVMRHGKRVKYRSIVGYKRLDEFENKVLPYIYRVAKEDCLDLPPKVYQKLYIPMTGQQKKKYKEVQEQVASEIEGHEITHVVALAKLQKCRQVAAGFLYDAEREAITIPCGKYQELQRVLQDCMYGTRKAVIFTSFIAEPEMVESTVNNLPMRLRAKAFLLPRNPQKRQELVDEWGAYTDGPAILIGNAKSGGTGLNLQAADIALFMSNDWAMEDRAQAEDRVHRMGSEIFDKILIIDLITKDTVEEDILTALKTKRALVEIFLERIRKKQKGEPVQ